MDGRTPPILIAVGETVWVLKVLASWGIWLNISSVVTAPEALMLLASTVIRLLPTGVIPLIDVPVAVTVTFSVAGAVSCAAACPAVAIAIALTDAPHRSFLAKRMSTFDLKIIGSSLRLVFRSASDAQV